MATEVIVKVFPGGLRAANQVEGEKLEQFLGQELMVRISKPRNLAFHRKYFAMIGTAFDMADHEYTKEQFRHVVQMGAGYCTWVHHDGQVLAIPKSISFGSMSDDEFERLYQDSLTYICKTWVLDEAMLNQMLEFM